jgi:hypothetical protein
MTKTTKYGATFHSVRGGAVRCRVESVALAPDGFSGPGGIIVRAISTARNSAAYPVGTPIEARAHHFTMDRGSLGRAVIRALQTGGHRGRGTFIVEDAAGRFDEYGGAGIPQWWTTHVGAGVRYYPIGGH